MLEELHNQEFETNQLRERAKKKVEITEEMWLKVSEYNREKVDEFLNESTHLSPKSFIQYRSALREFYHWVYENLKDKKIYEIKKKEFYKYQNSLQRRGVSSNGIKAKRSAVSSMNKYLINFYEDEEEFETFRNFVEGVPNPSPTKVYDKKPLSLEEYELICKTLEEKEEWQVLAILKVMYASACRRTEAIQLKKDTIHLSPIKDKEGKLTKMYRTAPIRAKGKGEQGEVRPLIIDQEAIDAIKKWLDIRGEDDSLYIFVAKYRGEINQIDASAVNYWFSNIISPIVNRRVNPHLTRGTRATHSLIEGKDIKIVKTLLGHKDIATTQNFYDLRDDDENLDELF